MQEQLGLTADQVRELVRSGALPVLRILDVWRVEAAAVDRLIDTAREASWAHPEWCDGAGASRARRGTGHRTPHHGVGCTDEEGDDPSSHPQRGPVRVGSREPAAAQRGTRTPHPPLTHQQRRVLALIGEGLPNDEIAARLSLQVSTVKSHVARLLLRLDLPDRGRLIAHAWRSGLLEPTG
ncbi:LuxR C-terminal-related transcriptional regulator [Cellulomonas sp. NPDC057328]|uniref:helix-turn-helix transcriptional regulator n=1 Tax=Cellulomonas sp. NPDC057328 TaxID=3346101 RepID=UPI003637A8F0